MNFQSRPASALLISVFLTGILLALVLSVSYTVLQDLKVMRTVRAGIKAEYAAEGANELSLMSITENLPGYEPEWSDLSFQSLAAASSSVTARGADLPCSSESSTGWRALSLNESLQIPLFAQIDSEGNTEKLIPFEVEFYVGSTDGLPSDTRDDLVLRWKILGLRNNETEAISEVVSLQDTTSEEKPSVFGTALDGAYGTEYTSAKYYENMGGHYVYSPNYSIQTFLENHELSYLVLTNIIAGGSTANTLFVKFHSKDPEVAAVCEVSKISSTGQVSFGQAMKRLERSIKEGENLPVFDFVLYHTGGG